VTLLYAWADKPYLIAALRMGGSLGLMRHLQSIYPPKLVAGIAAAYAAVYPMVVI